MEYDNHINVISKIKEKVIKIVKDYIFKKPFNEQTKISYSSFYELFYEDYKEQVKIS